MLFRRTATMSELPQPQRGGTLADLWKVLNVEPEDLAAGAGVARVGAGAGHSASGVVARW